MVRCSFSSLRWLCLLLAASGSLAWSANLVVNGDFEQNGGLGQINVNPAISYATGWASGTPTDAQYAFNFIVDQNADNAGFPSVFSPGAGTNIYVWGPETPANKGGPQANGFTGSPNGGYFMGMDGGYATAAISQTINGLDTTKQYTLSFEYAFGQFTDQQGATNQSITVGFGGATDSTGTFLVPSKGFLGWNNFSKNFTPTSSSQLLSFLAVGPYGLPPFAFLDNVSLVEVTGPPPPPPGVPEPATLTLAALGACAVFGRYRRLKARQG
jgi:hypothetical protein